MSDIFISYASADRQQAEILAQGLKAKGWTVWWDRTIPTGRTFDEVIEEALDAAKSVIVLWSEKSVKSGWVRAEAQEGADRKILIPVLIEKVRIPLAFRRIQAANLIGWDGSYTTSSFQGLVGDIAALLDSPPKEEEKRKQAETEAKRKDVGASEQIEVKPTSEATIPTNLFKELPPSFRNPFEFNAEYILIPSGRYKYQGKTETEVPDIYFAKYPVTNKLYRRFIRYLEEKEQELLGILPKGEFDWRITEFASGIKDFVNYLGGRPNRWPKKLRSEYDSKKRFNSDDQPVVGVSWFATQVYCFWLFLLKAAYENLSIDNVRGLFRLPSEIEWEWAASGGKRKYPWASEKGLPTDKLVNFSENVRSTTLVGRYPQSATPEGLMDMAGNVWEWMENWYGKDEDTRSLRGGSWVSRDFKLCCTGRWRLHPSYRDVAVGFRVVYSQ
jgi:formylglycine-generating enzyme required for sulfatase activity